MEPPVHSALGPLVALLGRWSGGGSGGYPTIAPFDYVEEVEFTHVGKPFLAYVQHSHDLHTGEPRHGETGFWRAVGHGRLEVVLSHPTGVVEIGSGTISDEAVITIELATDSVVCSATAKHVTALARRFRLEGDELTYEVDMAAVGQPLQPHLVASLHRVG